MEKLFTYQCTVYEWSHHYDLSYNYVARNRSAAKYQLWKYLSGEDLTDRGYKDWMNIIKVKSLGEVKASDFFTSFEDFERMKEHRGIPFAYQGMIVEVSGKKGWITGANGFNLGVMFEGSSYPYSNCHPHSAIIYYNNKMEIIKEFGPTTPIQAVSEAKRKNKIKKDKMDTVTEPHLGYGINEDSDLPF